ncbi:efflux RND transporter periplasmic adaptor subunit [Saccharospirillum impatiens]|uniref:efflux RND transporter periplasmic adaptor subunit n=1 Tax=Saccharospirillum impatiens TaxID=169438 RepID=UPI0003FB9E85|nr:HlyD family efflux transporter periplasmic adaptor subunit [Saccharospirillum impatiens]
MWKKAVVVVALLAIGFTGYRWMNAPVESAASEQRRGNAAMSMRAGITGSRWGRDGVDSSAIQVEALEVSRTLNTPQIPLLGTVQAKRLEIITAPQAGRITEILIRSGDSVTAGEPLLRMEARAVDWALRQQQATIDQQQASIRIADRQHERNQEALAIAQRDLAREQSLLEQGFSNDTNVAAARQTWRSAQLTVANYDDEAAQRQSQLEQAFIELEQVQDQQLDLSPTAPFSADVASIDTAAQVQVEAGETLISLIDRDSLYVRTQVPLRVYRNIAGTEIDATAWLNNTPYPLTLDNLAATSNTGSVNLTLNLPRDIPVLINETLEVSLKLPPIESFAIPQNAVYYGDQIYQITEGSLQVLPIRILGYQQRDGEQWALIDSNELASEATILTTRLSQPTNGTPVTIVEPGTPSILSRGDSGQ